MPIDYLVRAAPNASTYSPVVMLKRGYSPAGAAPFDLSIGTRIPVGQWSEGFEQAARDRPASGEFKLVSNQTMLLPFTKGLSFKLLIETGDRGHDLGGQSARSDCFPIAAYNIHDD
jgi:hypothetical protein